MATESDPATTRITVVLDKPSDWHNWLFIRQDSAQRSDLWQYVNPDIAADELSELKEPVEPKLTDYKEGAESLGSLSADDRESYKWDYKRYRERYTTWSRKSRALADFNSEISKTVAKRHLYLLWSKSTPYERLVTLKQHLAPTDATRRRELIGKYAALQAPARGKKVEEWLRTWVDVTNQCKELKLAETTGTRA
ncbi:hypothetical protein K458DRAFT_465626 [Lentithecium fluviatile CBS 122367]|uniref:Uncharacterized protein n=1 Tax=Lentithecium fluviatile CBS 122367 TaxID=1168545 RepID=A0A6G1JEI3_9PLEO|nr:hypothetical protein K458DRAFT_465626 [Lentithecium fluviatile CBS 122367]